VAKQVQLSGLDKRFKSSSLSLNTLKKNIPLQNFSFSILIVDLGD
jgi:hypothetical protein